MHRLHAGGFCKTIKAWRKSMCRDILSSYLHDAEKLPLNGMQGRLQILDWASKIGLFVPSLHEVFPILGESNIWHEQLFGKNTRLCSGLMTRGRGSQADYLNLTVGESKFRTKCFFKILVLIYTVKLFFCKAWTSANRNTGLHEIFNFLWPQCPLNIFFKWRDAIKTINWPFLA